MPRPPLAGGLTDPGSPVLPQELGERSSYPQEYSLAYCVWLDTPTLNLVLATDRALSASALFISVCLPAHGCIV